MRLASLYMGEGELELALQRLDEALATESDHGEALLKKAEILQIMKKPAEAAALYQQGNPGQSPVHQRMDQLWPALG